MADYPSGKILDAWDRANKARPKRAAPWRSPFPPDAPRDRPRAADDHTAAATVWNSMRGAGVNVERGAGWGDVDWACMVATGNAWVRLFYPWRPDMDMNGPGSAAPQSDADLQRIVRGAEDAIQAGIPVVLLEATDVLDVSTARDHGDTIENHVRQLARLVRASPVLTIDNCAFGPVNEYAAGESDAEWKPHRDRFNGATREELPDHCLTTGGWYWKSLFDILETPDPAPRGDPNWIVDAHQYEQAGDWSEVADAMRAWMHQHNRLLVVGEIGPYNPNWEWLAREDWEPRYRAQGPIWSVAPLAPWATTYGSGLPVNTYGALDVDEMFHGLWLDHAAVQATRPAVGGGTEPPEPIIPFAATLASRTDLQLVVTLTAPAGKPVKMAVVENGTFHWREEPVDVAPGTVTVDLFAPSDFAKFIQGGKAIDVPTPQEAADYVPTNGGDIQTAFADGYAAGWAACQEQATAAFGERMDTLEQPPPPAYQP
jgi:hypothetical protein